MVEASGFQYLTRHLSLKLCLAFYVYNLRSCFHNFHNYYLEHILVVICRNTRRWYEDACSDKKKNKIFKHVFSSIKKFISILMLSNCCYINNITSQKYLQRDHPHKTDGWQMFRFPGVLFQRLHYKFAELPLSQEWNHCYGSFWPFHGNNTLRYPE